MSETASDAEGQSDDAVSPAPIDIPSTFLSSDAMDQLLQDVRDNPQPITLPAERLPGE